ncbi:methionine aminopeptidase 1D, mitochondrial [Octopus vulgaris]|uniref:Methionine aminopeptidase n=1 Tax=Octopus vulgaris TaxID=6645 RepID=A0AA36BTX4_OCTVU|nr:methionine aminopeptidase 1D, mitochondrial [Octopus vulgaris]
MPGLTYQVLRGLRSALKNTKLHIKRVSSYHGPHGFAFVKPEKVSKTLLVPAHIQRPPYVSVHGNDPHPNFIEIHSDQQIDSIRNSCSLARRILDLTSQHLKVGITTDELDKIVHNLCIDHDAYPSPLFYNNYPKSVCTSVNNVACHGIPDSRPLQNGDIINIDITVYINGYHGDVSETYLIGDVDERGQQLVETARRALMEAINICKDDVPFSEIGRKVNDVVTAADFQVIPDFCGHGIGRYFHGLPDIFHIDLGCKTRMKENMVFTIEPLVCEGSPAIKVLSDGWTAVTRDFSRSAQFEHCVRVTQHGAEILTQ